MCCFRQRLGFSYTLHWCFVYLIPVLGLEFNLFVLLSPKSTTPPKGWFANGYATQNVFLVTKDNKTALLMVSIPLEFGLNDSSSEPEIKVEKEKQEKVKKSSCF